MVSLKSSIKNQKERANKKLMLYSLEVHTKILYIYQQQVDFTSQLLSKEHNYIRTKLYFTKIFTAVDL